MKEPADQIAGVWLVISRETALAVEVARLLNEQGAACQLMAPAELPELGAPDGALGGVIQICDSTEGLLDTLHLVQTLIARSIPVKLWIITTGAQAVVSDVAAPAQATVWGLARTVMLEQPDLHCRCIDLDPLALAAANAHCLLHEFTAAGDEDQIAYHNEQRYVARLTQPPHTNQPASPVHLVPDSSGLLDRLSWQPSERRAPGEGEIEIQVQATGLNFRDVLNALGMYPGDAGPLGSECAGVVTAVGACVDRFQIGDAVLALARDTFSSSVITRAEFAAPKPIGLSWAQAAALPIAFLTAQYGFHQLAQLRSGERVLIHAAAGGVGLAAVQIAQRAGAEIYGTAGSPEKRQYLQSIGVAHVLDSRTLDFAEEIKQLTNGAGVDVVLNALSGEFINKSVSVLKPQGRFLEIGKRGIWTAERMAQTRPDVAYHVYDLGDVMRDSPRLIQTLLCEVLHALDLGELKPLPTREFPANEAVAAFQFMEHAKHIGKIAVMQRDVPPNPIAIRPTATYLITGGLGGLGLQAARWLVEQGARHLLLLGRSAPSSAAQAIIGELEQQGAEVSIGQADVTQVDQLEALISSIDPAAPLRGIIHAAGTLADGVGTQQTAEHFAAVLAPKIEGAQHLYHLTQDQPLDFFVLYSSAASVLGSIGQGNYAAANAGLDAFAHRLRARGLPAVSVDWGPWSEVGMAATLSAHDQDRRRAQGMRFITPVQGTQALAHALQQGMTQVLVLPIDWRRYVGQAVVPPLLREVLTSTSSEKAATVQAVDVVQQVLAAPPSQRRAMVQTLVRAHAIKVLGLGTSYSIDPQRPLSELGLDSLMAVELRNALGVSLKRALPATLLFDYPTLTALTDFLLNEIAPVEAPLSHPAIEEAHASTAAAELAQLTEAEAEALLLAELSAGKKRAA